MNKSTFDNVADFIYDTENNYFDILSSDVKSHIQQYDYELLPIFNNYEIIEYAANMGIDVVHLLKNKINDNFYHNRIKGTIVEKIADCILIFDQVIPLQSINIYEYKVKKYYYVELSGYHTYTHKYDERVILYEEIKNNINKLDDRILISTLTFDKILLRIPRYLYNFGSESDFLIDIIYMYKSKYFKTVDYPVSYNFISGWASTFDEEDYIELVEDEVEDEDEVEV